METIDAIKIRHSSRSFSDRPISPDNIEKIVDCGRLAPTARKEEPWEFIAITERETLKKLANLTDHGTFIQSAACAIIVCCRDTKYYLEDGCAATENMLVAAASLGVGSCWVAGDKKPYCAAVLGLLNIPSSFKLVSIVALGYPTGTEAALEKRPLAKVLHWQRF